MLFMIFNKPAQFIEAHQKVLKLFRLTDKFSKENADNNKTYNLS